MPIRRSVWTAEGWKQYLGDPGVPAPTPVETGRDALVIGSYKPDATTTGLLPGFDGATLPILAGDQIITVDGTTIENRKITGRLIIRARNVTIRNCLIVGNGSTSGNGLIDALNSNVRNLLIEDCELRSDVPTYIVDGVYGRNYTLNRCHIHRVLDAFRLAPQVAGDGDTSINVNVLGCYIHSLAYMSPWSSQSDNRTHNDGGQIMGGSGIVIRGNNISTNVSDVIGVGGRTDVPAPNWAYPSITGQALGLTPTGGGGPIKDCLIELNWLDYGAQSITVIKDSWSVSGVMIRNNKFGRNQPLKNAPGTPPGGVPDPARRPLLIEDTSVSVNGMTTNNVLDTQGNVFEDTGLPITIYRFPLANI